mgnify:CR=1 FL=1
MSHTGGKEGTYPGTRASATMIGDDETNWGTKSLAILDMPFTAVMDTLLLPWDVFRKDSSVRSRVEKSEANAQETNNVIPPAKMPANRELAVSFGDPQLTVLHPRQPLTIRRENHGVRRRWIGVVFG